MLSYSIDCLFRSGSRDQHSSVGRTQTSHYCGSVSQCAVVSSGVAWIGAWISPIRPLLYVLYTADIQKLVELLVFGVHMYADDTQLHGSCKVSEAADLAGRAVPCASSTRSKSGCHQTVFGWMLIRPSSFGWAQVTSSESVTCRRSIQSCRPSIVVNNLGVYLDSELTLGRQVSKLCQVCYFHLHRLRTVHRSLSKECLRTLVHAFVTSWVDHCNGLLYGSYSYLLDRLQFKVQRNLGCNPWRATLATNQKAHRVQNCSSGVTLPGRRCTGVLDGTALSCQFSRWSTKPPVCFPRRPHHSSFPTPHIWFPNFCCLGPSALELTLIGR